MNTPPEPPPEGALIEAARRDAGLSVREAARRAGISESWWRYVARGYQSLSGGTYGLIRDIPAGTIARMARAAGQVTPEQMEAEGQRPDAAEVMRKQAASRPAAPRDRPPAGLEFTPELEADMAPHLAEVRARVEVASQGTPAERLTGRAVFPFAPADQDSWDQLRGLGYTVAQVARMIAVLRADDDWSARTRRPSGTAAGLTRA